MLGVGSKAGPCFAAGAGLITVTERAKRVCGWAARWGRYHAGAWHRDGRRPTNFAKAACHWARPCWAWAT